MDSEKNEIFQAPPFYSKELRVDQVEGMLKASADDVFDFLGKKPPWTTTKKEGWCCLGKKWTTDKKQCAAQEALMSAFPQIPAVLAYLKTMRMHASTNFSFASTMDSFQAQRLESLLNLIVPLGVSAKDFMSAPLTHAFIIKN